MKRLIVVIALGLLGSCALLKAEVARCPAPSAGASYYEQVDRAECLAREVERLSKCVKACQASSDGGY